MLLNSRVETDCFTSLQSCSFLKGQSAVTHLPKTAFREAKAYHLLSQVRLPDEVGTHGDAPMQTVYYQHQRLLPSLYFKCLFQKHFQAHDRKGKTLPVSSSVFRGASCALKTELLLLSWWLG